MEPKLIEGLSLLIGLFIILHALFSDTTDRTSATISPDRGEKRTTGGRWRAAYLLAGSSLLLYGLAEVMRQSVS